ncbi:prephenate dehydratase [Chromobacterium subtsugae]|uniref:Bifunctional chorismate mutase/prephenate dehydratase n=1 Tax=Chromobacterium subtsugae TaxID=251747 RepID=A0ABS7FEH0_9NEIS|nr:MULTISPECIES: prephenate dehydratase [Chromobacterium]KUM01623.1 prephenate dehydratase [Chromobacterium subtsugae]KZE87725.1 prephenate dehydratase [Chromobacterium sp. F49]MBW7568268.1 prephenate dehydratase [Chromobacterium subtsugae]MBW8288468.1 prephenate dehydratase [Chromobacterium subtsugae]OBU86737.1 prephenate dehydratase [Chromobacterium subtsugae]
MSESLLKQHRDAIDAIDVEILTLLNQRASHAREIGEIKGGGIIYRPEREAQVLRRLKDLNPGPLPSESIARLFREVMSECLALEKPLSIAYLGPEGTFSQLATVKHFGHAARAVACASIDEAFRLVESRALDYVVAPVENSTEGAVGRTLDLMVSSPLKICGEVVLRIHHHLLRSAEGFDGIRRVYAHAQALAQCHEWLNKNLPADVERVSVASNAEAARLASEDASAAAIAGQAAAERYALLKLAENVEDEPNNTTRFLVLGLQDVGVTGQDKTSVVVSAPNRPGAVHQLLEPVAANGVSMSKFESRPSRAGLWDYVFFIDLEGHRQDERVQKALAGLGERTSFVKVLGSYPAAVL